MATRNGIFKAVPEAPHQDNDKLVDLFRNRAELLDPEWVHNVVTFYQLRRLAKHCASRLARFAEQLKQQREKRALDGVLNAWRAEQEQARAAVRTLVGEQRSQLQRLENGLQAECHRFDMMGGLSRVMKGKVHSQVIEDIERSILDAQAKEGELLRELERVESAEPPPNPGLDVSAKRSINFMILAYAQQLYIQYFEDNLVNLAKEAGEKSVGAVSYGSKGDCDEILARLAPARAMRRTTR